MKEIAFKLSRDSKLYKTYMDGREAEENLRYKARKFAEKYFKTHSMSYLESARLTCSINTPGQTCKEKREGLYVYRKNSDLNKAWEREVYNSHELLLIDNARFWWLPYIRSGSYKMWDFHGEVYGYLSNNNDTVPEIPDGATEIKMSEYYKVIEEYEEENKKC